MRWIAFALALAACARSETGVARPGDVESGVTTLCDEVGRGLVAWYRFEESDPAVAITDSSGNDIAASCAPCPAATTGAVGSGFEFSAADGSIVRIAPDNPALLRIYNRALEASEIAELAGCR